MPTGIPFKPEKETVLTLLKECKGVVTYAAQRMNVDRHTLQKYIDQHEDVLKVLHDLRFNYDEEQLDAAQDVLSYAIKNRTNDVNAALKASIYLLNNKGKKRGFAHPTNTTQVEETVQSEVQEINRNMKQAYELLDKKV